MSNAEFIYYLFIFISIFTVSLLLMRYLLENPVQKRLRRVTTVSSPHVSEEPVNSHWIASIAKYSSPLARLSMPEEGWEQSALRIRFMNAGIRNEHAPMIFFALKTTLATLIPLLSYLLLLTSSQQMGNNALFIFLLLAATIGLYLPNFILSRMIRARQRKIFETIPDALDLLTICIEAGLAIDAGIARVAQEMATVAPEVSDELNLVSLELRAGNSKNKALRNLALRTGVDDIDILVAMLIQAEKFGTSIGLALRVHAEHLRTKRRQFAEEKAAKIALKLLFPLIFCIFPSLLGVVMGPAMIQIMRAFKAPV